MAPKLALIASNAALAFFIGAPQVSGFGQEPLQGRGGGGASDPEIYKIPKTDKDGNCLPTGYVRDGFCYHSKKSAGYCDYLAEGCLTSGGNAKSCQNYDWNVLIEACPSLEAAGTSDFCLRLATDYTQIQGNNVWCSSLNGQGEATCESHYLSWTDTVDGRQVETYQRCEYNTLNGKCKSRKMKIGTVNYGVIQRCGPFCPVDRTNMILVDPFYCSTGLPGSTVLDERLTNKDTCENSYSTSVASGALLQCKFNGGTAGCESGSSCACKEGTLDSAGCEAMGDLCCVGDNCQLCDNIFP